MMSEYMVNRACGKCFVLAFGYLGIWGFGMLGLLPTMNGMQSAYILETATFTELRFLRKVLKPLGSGGCNTLSREQNQADSSTKRAGFESQSPSTNREVKSNAN